jgi:hypothetical protein
VSNELGRWAKQRAPALLARAEEEAVVALRNALLDAALPPDAAPERNLSTEERAHEDSGGEGLWGYCVLPAGAAFGDPRPGVHPLGAPLPIENGDLCALVSQVPLDEFGEQALRRNLNDLEWVERVARAHERVVEQVLRASTTVVPLRLCTIFQDEDGVRRMLERERTTLNDALQRLDGCQEWGVKVLVDRDALQAAAAARSRQEEQPDDETAPASGTAYLHRRRLERDVRDEAAQLAAEIADDIHSCLRDSTSAATAGQSQNRALSGHEGEMLLNGAYLVHAGQLGEFHDLITQLENRYRALRVRLVVTGPWPPYNFLTEDLVAS